MKDKSKILQKRETCTNLSMSLLSKEIWGHLNSSQQGGDLHMISVISPFPIEKFAESYVYYCRNYWQIICAIK